MNLLSYLLLALTQCGLLIPASPILTTPSSLVRRTRYCANIPGQVAGSYSSPKTRSFSSTRPVPRALDYAFCAGGRTRTFVLITLASIIPIEEPLVENLISQAMEEITQTMKALDFDGPIIGGAFTQVYDDLAVWVTNSNNHQLTWGVLGTALVAIGDYFDHNGGWGAVEFAVWDGDNEVGRGRIGVTR